MKYYRYLMALIMLYGLFGFVCPADAAKAFQVIVHVNNPNESISVKKLKTIFLKNKGKWPKSNEKVTPLDLPENSSVRKNFSKAVLNKTVSAVVTHWQKQIFAARGKAPKKVSNDQEVIQYVAQNPGAVGYISGSAELSDPNIKLLVGKSKKSAGDLSW